jgi:Holliday junction resolvase-like predicted endonuclease
MVKNTNKLGNAGEAAGATYLANKGYRIIEKNHRRRYGEIDLVAQDPRGIIVFAEVKTMIRREGGLKPEDQLTRGKLHRMKRIAEIYANQHPELIREHRSEDGNGGGGWRIDLLAIEVVPGERRAIVRHYQGL